MDSYRVYKLWSCEHSCRTRQA